MKHLQKQSKDKIFIIYRISQKTWLNNKHTLIWTWNLKIPKSHQTLFYNVISEALVFYNQGKVYILFAQCSNLQYSTVYMGSKFYFIVFTLPPACRHRLLIPAIKKMFMKEASTHTSKTDKYGHVFFMGQQKTHRMRSNKRWPWAKMLPKSPS